MFIENSKSLSTDIPLFLARNPFIRFLIPLLTGILLQYFLHISTLGIWVLCTGIFLIGFSYILHPRFQFRFRWLFGAGAFLSFLSIGIISTTYRQNQSAFTHPDSLQKYIGTVTEISKEKEKSLTCEVRLKDTNKKIVVYLQKGVRSSWLSAGDEIEFDAQITPLKHFGNPLDFDYPLYLYHKGFSGSVYLFSDDWEATGNKSTSLQTEALHYRQKILDFYHSLNLNQTEFALLAALTLGDKNALSDDLKNIFRTTGTAHILAVSGMHVGIICAALITLFGLFCTRTRYNRIAQVLLILSLWIYAYITGLPPSVIRASTVLSIFCLANIFNRKVLTYNNIAIAAFFMLVYNPFYLFDIGFQLSFSAVLAICAIHPFLRKILTTHNKYVAKIWNLFSLSLAAQLGTFPICVYYFGMFPTYFFITNLLIVPLVSCIVYVALILFVCQLVSFILPQSISAFLFYIPVYLLKGLVFAMQSIASFFAGLPFASIDKLHISLSTTFILLIIVFLCVLYTHYKNIKYLRSIFALILVWCILYIVPPKDSFSVYRENGLSKVAWNTGHTYFIKDSVSNYNYTRVGNKAFLSLSGNYWVNKKCPEPLPIDYLHIVNGDSLSLNSLKHFFFIKRVILDASLSGNNKRRLKKECKKLSIPYYDVSEKGFFRIIF